MIGPHAAAGGADFEVRAFIPGDAAAEDPVTGSFNAGVARWLIGSGRAPVSYTAAQGTMLGRGDGPRGRHRQRRLGGRSSITCISGTVVL